VPHAGETTGPETIWDAVRELKAERIGHGTSTMQDPELVEYLRDQQIPLEVSPTSNIATRAVASYDVHPLRAMVDAGLVVTINSDDPPMFGTDLTNEYVVAARLLECGWLVRCGKSVGRRWPSACCVLPPAAIPPPPHPRRPARRRGHQCTRQRPRLPRLRTVICRGAGG
jgi:hypothetical protein